MIVELRHPAEDAGPGPDAVMVEWLLKVGDMATPGGDLYRYEIDKAIVTVAASAAGVLRSILVRPGERFRAGDVVAVLSGRPDEALPAVIPAPSAAGCKEEGFDWSEIDVRDGESEPLGVMRTIIADRMAMSKRFIPCFYLTSAVDMTNCIELRRTLKSEGGKATFNDMLIRASALALRRNPRVLGVYFKGAFQPRNRINIGFAAALPDNGLVVPVVKDADGKSLTEIAAETRAFAQKVRIGNLIPGDCSGSVFSVSYLGSHEVDEFAAIVNPGEAAILAAGRVRECPVVKEGEVVVRPLMKITLSADHRTIDGALAARFAGDVKAILEQAAEL